VFLRSVRRAFREVKVVRPEATLARGSKEVYLVCRGPRRTEESSAASQGSSER
jgi:23S rRNA U2552 (ribose-2'-O)-methylase RlmE/FtsJ